MASRLNPYLHFAGTAREAMEFYQSVLGGSLSLDTFGKFGTTEEPMASQIMHGMLETEGGFALMGSDIPPGTEVPSGSSITLSLSGDDPELRPCWEALTEGGTVTFPLEKQMWGDEFGQLVDRFGVAWMVNISPPQG